MLSKKPSIIGKSKNEIEFHFQNANDGKEESSIESSSYTLENQSYEYDMENYIRLRQISREQKYKIARYNEQGYEILRFPL